MMYQSWSVGDTDSWRDLSDAILPMDHRFPPVSGDWRATLTVQVGAAYQLLHWDQHGHRFAARTAPHIRRVPADHYYWVVVPETGSYNVRHDQEVTRTLPGQASAMGMDESCQISIPTSRAFAFQVPRAEIDGNLRPDGPLRLLLDLDTGLGRILSNLITSTHAEQGNLTDREFHAICDRITELLCMLALNDSRPQESHLTDVAQVVRRYVRENFGSGKLPLPAVAQALGWSPRQLRNALHEVGTTFRDLRNEENLRAARDLLQDPASADLSVGEIAARAGLTSTWFSSAFKGRYGESPREFRRRRLAETKAAAADASPSPP